MKQNLRKCPLLGVLGTSLWRGGAPGSVLMDQKPFPLTAANLNIF